MTEYNKVKGLIISAQDAKNYKVQTPVVAKPYRGRDYSSDYYNSRPLVRTPQSVTGSKNLGVSHVPRNPLEVNANGMNIDADLANKQKQKNKSVTNQKYQTKGKQTLLNQPLHQKKGEVPKTKGDWKTVLRNQTSASKGGGRSGGGGKGLIGNQTAKDPTGLSMLFKKLK
tara:strand:+ start:62 stop:571 length:510 start_codon:yes stop_codon:yes gene_type:complete